MNDPTTPAESLDPLSVKGKNVRAATPTSSRIGDPSLAAKLRQETEGEVLFDAFSRGRYSTDASIYQIEPVGVVVPRTWHDVVASIQIAAESDIAILPRGGGTSQCGQTVAEALVIDVSTHLNKLLEIDIDARRAAVEPGMVLDQLNARLASRGLMFPVDVSTASRATVGGMAGNNSCGSRSIRYGTMRDNVHAIDAILAGGERASFGPLPQTNDPLTHKLLDLGQREAKVIKARFPQLQRRVGGYNIDALIGSSDDVNLAGLLVGSEGTLAFSERIHLLLQPIPTHKVLGVCHFPSFYAAMDATQHLTTLGPSAVELIDRTMIDLARDISIYRTTVDRLVKGRPEALLLVEFAGDEPTPQFDKLKQLVQHMDDLGFPDSVVTATKPEFQKEIWEVRKAGLNIMMSMKGDGKPISFIEDCAVRLEDLAEYTRRLTDIFDQHGTTGTWYAHASVGCLHVRPILNLKLEADAKKMRAIAEQAFAMVREYKGSHSGEHGDGLVRSEFHQPMFGSRMTENFRQVKDLFDPKGLMNPGKIVNPSKMDDRSLFRYKPGYGTQQIHTALDWSQWGGFAGAVEMCNNNGACRKNDTVMCPSYRATGSEQHVTRGRANSLRLALSGQLGSDAFTSRDMYNAMALCVGCKGCKRECPTGVDMARMKIEFLHHYHRRHGMSAHERITAYLPRYARTASRFRGLINTRNDNRTIAKLGQRFLGLHATRPLPVWRAPFVDSPQPVGDGDAGELVLFADTFNRYFEPENLDAAVAILSAAGHRIHYPVAIDGSRRPLCCGRTFLSAGLVDQARTEAQRTLSALRPYLDRGLPVVGLEPSCMLTFRDEYPDLLGLDNASVLAANSSLFESFLSQNRCNNRLEYSCSSGEEIEVFIHGHCHQKAFGEIDTVATVLAQIPGLKTEIIPSTCCGMAGAFGYNTETHDISVQIAELDLLPAIRRLPADAWLVADGTSCRHQITDLSEREVLHVARFLQQFLV